MDEKKKILVIEDDESLNYIIRKDLNRKGYETYGLKTGKEVISNLSKEKYDLLLLDYSLPDMNASQIIEKLRHKKIYPHFIVITGQGDERLAVEMMKKGAKDYIIKDPNFISFVPNIIERVFNDIKREEKLKEAENALVESEIRYRSLIELSPDVVVVLTDEKIVYINTSGLHLFRVTNPQEIYGKSLSIIIHKDYRETVSEQLKRNKIKGGTKDIIQAKFIRLDGYPIDVELAMVQIFYEGSPSVQIVVRDISERIMVQEQLIEEKERLSVTLKSISDGMIATDVNGKVVLINNVAESLTGWAHQDAVGVDLSKIYKIIDEKQRKTADNPVKSIIKEGALIKASSSNILISKSGKEYNLIESASPIKDKNNNILGVVLVFRDVTIERKMEEEIQKMQKLESLGILAGGIAHDFNNVITGILGNISLAMLKIKKEDEIYQILTDAQAAVNQARELSLQLLTFAKGGAPLKKVVNTAQTINEATNFVLRGSKVMCVYHLSDDLWNIKVDEGQMHQVITNIIINAEQAMPKGGIIHITAKNIRIEDEDRIPLKKGDYVMISIKDSGNGIPEELLDKIFDPYFTTKQRGNGLGLATCFSIINKHNGHITVESVVEEGTTFTIYVPASKQEAAADKKNELLDNKRENKIKTLVMEDEEIVRNVIGKMLELLNCDVDFAYHGEEAIKLYKKSIAKKSVYDIVIMDLTIPGKMGGEAAIDELKKINPSVKAIVSSGYSNNPVMANYQDYGFAGVIAKPYRIEDLGKIIDEVLKKK